ncbi:MAG: hypothetical protein Q8O99_03975 [bacterium]|nr:hypothetical protein [bacterium]
MTVEKAEELIEEALAHNFSVEGDSCPKARCLIWKENNTYP